MERYIYSPVTARPRIHIVIAPAPRLAAPAAGCAWQLGMMPAMVRSAALLLCVALTAASLQSFPSPLAPHSGRACPALSGRGCSACIAATDGRCPGHWCDQPCVHTSQGAGKGRKEDCFPANWWATQKHTYPKVTCTGNGTGCHRVCGTPPAPAPPAPSPSPHPGPVPPPADVATATYLTDYPNAVCLDGSPGYYVCAHCTPRPFQCFLGQLPATLAFVHTISIPRYVCLSELHLTVHQFGLAVVPPPCASWGQRNKMGLSYPRGRLVR
eukprot:COSAG02_NODE_10078_length_2031_cov_2.164079_1_plen_269_part_00